MSAASAWTEALASWAIPDHILEQAPESPWCFPPRLFAHAAVQALADPTGSPSRRRALEVLADGGSVLDVGAGAGAASLPLAPPAGALTAVDQSAEMLAEFASGADRRDVTHREVEGLWPAAASEVEPADVVVCHHVLYNVADLVPFADALTRSARRRVVVELSEAHPAANLNRLWKELHGIDRPMSPVAADAVAVLREMGLDVASEPFERGALWDEAARAEMVGFIRRRLCLGPDRDPEIDALIGPADVQPPRRLRAVWWPGAAPA
ncbi:MAG: class I SAM-dependent methyltransferase [Actinomycetota bacterium]